MKNVKVFALILPGFAIAILLIGCGTQGAYQQPVVTMGTTPATVQPGATAMLSASVTNDSSNMGVNWIVSCPGTPCGSVSPTNTPSGASTTYTAPAVAPAGDLTVTITAIAAAGGSIPASANFKVPGITVNVLPPSATPLQVNATSQITANVTGDAASKGVTWTVTCAVTGTTCGSIAPTTTANGAATTYTAPAIPPPGDLVVTVTAASVTNPAATSSTSVTIIGITVSIAPPSAVDSAGTEPLTATVNNDPSNGGVTWSLQITRRVCPRDGFGCRNVTYVCSVGCGSFSPGATANGAPTTYTAPGTPPPGTVAAVATSVTNTSAKSPTASITIRPIIVSVSTTPASVGSVALNAMLPLTATVTHDGANGGAGAGVTWTLTQNGVACSPGCGTILPPSTLSGASATYNAPATVPAYPVVTITATSVTDNTKSASVPITVTTASGAACGAGSGSESLLSGQYAFQLQTAGPGIRILAGSFTADGTGKITGGVSENGGNLQQIDTTRSFYWVGPDHRGCMTLGGASYYRIALGSINNSNIATSGHTIEFDDTTGTGSRMAGTLKLQDPTSFSAGKFKGTYVLGLTGLNLTGGRSAIAGTFITDGISAITGSNLDIDDAGTVTSNLASAPGGTFTCCDANGRGSLQLTTPTGLASGFVFYMVSSSDAFILSSSPTYSGEAFAVPAMTTFTQASLNGAPVIRTTAQTSMGPLVDIALATANGTGGITIKDNINNAGTFTQSTTPPLTYSVASNGRVTLMPVATLPVLYLYSQNAGFLVGTDGNVDSGVIEPQVGGPFSNASLSGAFTLGIENALNTSTSPATFATLESGVVTADGAGNVAGTSDQSSSSGLAQNQNVSLTYSVAADGTGTFGTGTTSILISGNKLAFITNTSATPTITVVEK